jgi:hypothetical protein
MHRTVAQRHREDNESARNHWRARRADIEVAAAGPNDEMIEVRIPLGKRIVDYVVAIIVLLDCLTLKSLVAQVESLLTPGPRDRLRGDSR